MREAGRFCDHGAKPVSMLPLLLSTLEAWRSRAPTLQGAVRLRWEAVEVRTRAISRRSNGQLDATKNM